MKEKQFCSYYQAYLSRKESWYVVALLKSFEHLVFDRTLDQSNSLFEFFVPVTLEHEFVTIMNYFLKEHLIKNFIKLPNRLQEPSQQV